MRVFSLPPRPRLLAASLLGACALGLAACSAEETTPAQVEAPVDLTVDPARVLLQDPGQGPHRTLRYADRQAEQRVTVEVGSGFDQQVMRADAVQTQAPEAADGVGEASTLTLPLRASSSATPSDADSADEREVTTTLGHPTATTARAEDLEGTQDFELGWRGDDSGRVASVNLAAPAEASDEGRALVEQALMKLLSLPVIFPEEPVGVGAVWSVDSRVTGEATLLQTTTYTLTALDGDDVELAVSVQQRPAQGALTLDAPEGQGAQTLDVMNANTASSGSLRLNLGEPLPRSGEVALTTRVVYGQDASEVRVVQDSSTRVAFSTSS
ncbi:hypothetical protein V5S96_03440 [Corynebacterium mastitidis]|uniref:Secreted protein n=1 Tax=Corynebacterium mastitidis TaxID=161890 RepID=A0ABU8NX18_9CORY